MTTTLLNSEIELSKQLNDYWSSATTSVCQTTTIVDTALKAKENDWVTDNSWAFLIEEPASAAAIYDERRATSLDNSSGTLTTLAFAATPGSATETTNYQLHRLFSPSEYRLALIYAARAGYPQIHEKIWDETIVSGNWLKDGSVEIWTSTTALTHWTATGVTLEKTLTSPYYKHGAYSCKISGTTGKIEQSISNWDDLKRLAGKRVKLSAQVHCDTASDCRIGICYDGTNYSNSSYHDGGTDWTTNADPLEVEYTIDDTPTDIKFRIQHNAGAGTIYVDDIRVICGETKPRQYIADIGLAQEKPVQVYIEPSYYSTSEPWTLIHNPVVDTENGYLYLPSTVSNDYRLRIIGMGYLDFLASGVSSTAWTATINIEKPQLDILIAEAAVYLYTQMSLPNFTQGTRRGYQEMLPYWQNELRMRRNKFGMPIPNSPVKYR